MKPEPGTFECILKTKEKKRNFPAKATFFGISSISISWHLAKGKRTVFNDNEQGDIKRRFFFASKEKTLIQTQTLDVKALFSRKIKLTMFFCCRNLETR